MCFLRIFGRPLMAFDTFGLTRWDTCFEELSDSQRCLICLYAILHFVLAQDFTIFLDEPDNLSAL